MQKLLKIVPYLIIAVAIGGSVSYAGSLTPPGSPENTMYSLTDIFNLADGTTTTEGSGAISSTPGSVSATGKTLTEVYDAIADEIAAIDDSTILTGTTIFGVDGSASAGVDLSNMFNGTGVGITGGSQQYGGVEDYNGDGGNPQPVNTYSGSWTQCTGGNSYCGTSDSAALYKDDSTGLIWSNRLTDDTWVFATSPGDAFMTWFEANNCTETTGSACTKKSSSKTGCEANTGWYVPHQKQIMQAYINGISNKLGSIGVDIWSATTMSDDITYGRVQNIQRGDVEEYTAKTDSAGVRCVRSS